MKRNDLPAVINLWNNSCQNELVYKNIDMDKAEKMFLKTDYFRIISFVSTEKGKITGFCSGTILTGRKHGYITTIIVDTKYRNRGTGTRLLKKLENEISKVELNTVRVDYSNPVSIPWIIPGTDFDHPCAPGIDMTSIGENFFISSGYLRRAEETSMGMPLDNFRIREEIRRKEICLNNNGIFVEMYNKNKHSGLEEFLESMGSESWKRILLRNEQKDNPLPLPIATFNGEVRGFAGPVTVEASGRGWFAGVGISPLCRGLGVGSVLFNFLCDNFKKSNARFVTLFTGINNNSARKIYLNAGLRILRHWSLMEKEL